MEITSCQSLSNAKLPNTLLNYTDSFFPFTATVSAQNSVNILGFNCLPRKLKYSITSTQLKNFGAIHASAAESSSASVVAKWVLEPIGDGDTRRIGFKTGMPNAFEIASKAEESLLITDLDSTNGTFIDEKQLRPGVAASALPGSKITFGDTHLAIFRISKPEVVEATKEPEAEAKIEEEANNST